MTSLAGPAARGAASTVFFQLIRMIIGFIAMIIAARILSPRDFGLFAMILAIVSFAEIIRDFGFMNAAVQAPTMTHRQRSNLFWLNVVIGLALGAVLVLAAPLVSAFYKQDELTELTSAIAIVFVINGASIQYKADLTRQLRIVFINIAETVAQFVAAAGLIVSALNGFGYWSLFIQQLINATLGLIMVAIGGRWLPSRPGRAPMGHFIRYGVSLTAQQSLNYFVRNVDTIAIGRVFGASQLGFYDRAYQLLIIPINQLNAPLTRVALPVLSRIWHAGGEFTRYLRVAQSVAAYVTVPLFAMIVGVGEHGVITLYGERWALAGHLLQILAIGGFFRSLMQVTYWAYLASGRVGVMLRFDAVALPALAAIILLGLCGGVVGVAIAHSIGYFLYWLSGLVWMTRRLNLSLRPFIITAVQSVCVIGLPVAVASYVAASSVESAAWGLVAGVISGFGVIGLLVAMVPSVRREYVSLVNRTRLGLGWKG